MVRTIVVETTDCRATLAMTSRAALAMTVGLETAGGEDDCGEDDCGGNNRLPRYARNDMPRCARNDMP